MHFDFIVNKNANFYFFVQNLSEWHFSTRKKYNKTWKEELGNLNKKEERLLKEFSKIHKKYSFGKDYLGRPFFISEDPWEELSTALKKEEFGIVQKTFSSLKEKFEKLFKKDADLLKKWKEELNKKANKPSVVSVINKRLSKLYKAPLLEEEITVYLLFSTSSYSGGMGGVINKKSVLLEVSRRPFSRINHVIGILWHEVLHLPYFGKYHFFPLLDKEFGDDKKTWKQIEEATISSLFPNGILGREILNIKKKNLNTSVINNNESLLSLINKYIKNNKRLDEEFIRKAHKLLK